MFQIITTSGGNQAPRLFPTVEGQSRAQLEWLVLTQPEAAARSRQCEPRACFQLTLLNGFSSSAPLNNEDTINGDLVLPRTFWFHSKPPKEEEMAELLIISLSSFCLASHLLHTAITDRIYKINKLELASFGPDQPTSPLLTPPDSSPWH